MFFFFRVSFMELNLFGLLSFGFSSDSGLGEKWNGRIVFGDVVFDAIKENGVKNARIFVEKVPCFNVKQIDNGC